MSETTKEERDRWRAECVADMERDGELGCSDSAGFHRTSERIRLLDDADRLGELEADGHTRGACWDCGESLNEFYGVCLGCHKKATARIAELEDAYTTADAEAAGWATKADRLDAEVRRLKALNDQLVVREARAACERNTLSAQAAQLDAIVKARDELIADLEQQIEDEDWSE
jgi:hypothetical protein